MRFIDAGHKMVICMSSNIRNTKSIAIATGAWSEKLAKSASICCIVLHQCVIRLTIYKSYVWKYGQRQQSNISRKKIKLSGFMLEGIIKHQTLSLLPSSSAFRSHADVAALLAAPWYLQMCQFKKMQLYAFICNVIGVWAYLFKRQMHWPLSTTIWEGLSWPSRAQILQRNMTLTTPSSSLQMWRLQAQMQGSN